MKIKEVLSRSRNDFQAVYVCEFCNHENEDYGYEDEHFHKNVIPKMVCKQCGNATDLLSTLAKDNPDIKLDEETEKALNDLSSKVKENPVYNPCQNIVDILCSKFPEKSQEAVIWDALILYLSLHGTTSEQGNTIFIGSSRETAKEMDFFQGKPNGTV